SIALIAAGERWHGTTGPLRAAVEDLLGAGAILAALDPAASISSPGCSPEAAAARAAFVAARPRLYESLAACASGRELIQRGWSDDVATAAALDVTTAVPLLTAEGFVAA
ncbi:MAG: 2-phosphosulfolactate phosphatase, partial [Ilumatobacteraceae bacterium]